MGGHERPSQAAGSMPAESHARLVAWSVITCAANAVGSRQARSAGHRDIKAFTA